MSFNHFENAAMAQVAQQVVTSNPALRWYAIQVNEEHIINGATHPVSQGTLYFSLQLQDTTGNIKDPKNYSGVTALKHLQCKIRQTNGRNPARTLNHEVSFADRLGTLAIEFGELGTYDVELTGRAFRVDVKRPVEKPKQVVTRDAVHRRPTDTNLGR